MGLLAKIEHFLKTSGMRPSRFGRGAIGDPRLLRDLRRGRQPRPKTEAKIRAFIAAQPGAGR